MRTALPITLMLVATLAALGWFVAGGQARGGEVDEVRDRREMVRAFVALVGVCTVGTGITWVAVYRFDRRFTQGDYAVGITTLACAVLVSLVVTTRLGFTLRTRPVYRATMVSWGALFAWGGIRVLLGVLGMRELLIIDGGNPVFQSITYQIVLTIPGVVPAALLALIGRMIFIWRRPTPA